MVEILATLVMVGILLLLEYDLKNPDRETHATTDLVITILTSGYSLVYNFLLVDSLPREMFPPYAIMAIFSLIHSLNSKSCDMALGVYGFILLYFLSLEFLVFFIPSFLG